MGRGRMVSLYKIGQFVSYKLRKQPDCSTGTGTILKLHKSGKGGVAEIKPSDNSCKISRKLTHVTSLE